MWTTIFLALYIIVALTIVISIARGETLQNISMAIGYFHHSGRRNFIISPVRKKPEKEQTVKT
jgi:hypothetical protein